MQTWKMTWFGNVRADVLSGMTVALALIPEAIAFSIIAGVDPMVGLHASVCIAIIIAFTGGRPAMISAATGAMAVVLVSLVAKHGVEYMLAATLLTGVIQWIMGMMKLGRFITFIPHSVIVGFVNALAILVFISQLVHFVGEGWQMYAIVGLTLLIIFGLPYLTKVVPSSMVAIVTMTILVVVMNLDMRTVGDMGKIAAELPMFHWPEVLWGWETLRIILPYSLTLAVVGLVESLLTAGILDEMTGTKSNKNIEMGGQGMANVVSGLFGGMAGCAMIGQSVINVRSGGRGRLSTLISGVFLLFLIMVLGDVVALIPMAALVSVMFMVSLSTFEWRSVTRIHKVPRIDAVVMVTTVAVVLFTHNLAAGVLAGVVLSALHFGWQMSRLRVDKQQLDDMTEYTINGPLFFGTMTAFIDAFQPIEEEKAICLNFSRSQLWDQSAAVALSKVKSRYVLAGKRIEIRGLNASSRQLLERLEG